MKTKYFDKEKVIKSYKDIFIREVFLYKDGCKRGDYLVTEYKVNYKDTTFNMLRIDYSSADRCPMENTKFFTREYD
jgi:hypothetical protein